MTEDRVRDEILRHLFNVHKKSRSPRSAAVGIRELQAALRNLNYKQNEVSSNLDYLLQKGWVREVREERSFTTKNGTTQHSEKISYKISDVGIDLLEGAASLFKRPPNASGVNITTIQGVTVVGNGNVVNTDYTELFTALNQLRSVVLDTELGDEMKLNILSDIDTLQSQLQKPTPDGSIISKVWAGLEKGAAAAGALDFVTTIATLLRPLVA